VRLRRTTPFLLVLAGLALGAASARAATQTYSCLGAQTTLFDNTNGDLITDTGSPPSFSTKGKAYCMTYIQTTPKPVILDGSYTCYDSDPSTWSADKSSGGAGFCIVKVVPAIAAAGSTTTATTTAAGPPTTSSSGGGSGLAWLWILLAILGVGILGLGTYGASQAKKPEEERDALGMILSPFMGWMGDGGPPPPMTPDNDPLFDLDGTTIDIPGDSSGPENDVM